ncbi:MAG: tungstate ABC transporter substrate-binding protein WtpA [Chloroflexota bacterium]|nr:tungstate ABC transporter substrate-binding protein WtpA [Chloroflexota bacterium]MDE3101013.1 tungstate ABC transporter substrate-binding protein WtpA [Chloroflexota bacterium]
MRSAWPAAVLATGAVLVSACGGGGAPSVSSGSAASGAANASAASSSPVTLSILAAGTLVNPFKDIDAAFMKKYPNVTVQAQFGGSVKMVKQITDLGQRADVVGVADYTVIPQYLIQGKKKYTDWYVGFVSNAITFVYTGKSKGASEITSRNWYTVMSRPGVRIGRSNPDTDPSGYAILQMLKLADAYYHDPGLSDAVLKNAPTTYMRDTETELIGALQAGEIDYLAIYRSDAKQHGFKYLDLPPEIDLSDAAKASTYHTVTVHTANGDIAGKPIVYALTVPDDAPQREWALRWAAFALGPDGRDAFSKAGFVVLSPALAQPLDKTPEALRPLVKQWP